MTIPSYGPETWGNDCFKSTNSFSMIHLWHGNNFGSYQYRATDCIEPKIYIINWIACTHSLFYYLCCMQIRREKKHQQLYNEPHFFLQTSNHHSNWSKKFNQCKKWFNTCASNSTHLITIPCNIISFIVYYMHMV